MRIAMVGTRGIPARSGGAERVVEAITDELTARGHEVLVYCREHYVAGTPEPACGQRIITTGPSGKHSEAFVHTAKAARDVRRRGVDVVHIHSPGPALWSFLPDRAGIPIVLTVHAPDWRRDKWSRLAKTALRCGLAAGMRRAAAVTCVSQPLAEELTGRFDRDVHYIPNAPPPVAPAAGEHLARMGLTAGAYGLFVGRVVPEKRLDLLMRAWTASGVDAPLAVVGHVGDDAYGKACKALENKKIRMLGERFGPELAHLYAGAGVVVQPSVLEGMSLVLLEAAANERCIIAADIPENRYAMGDSVLYFSADSEELLARRIGHCMACAEMRTDLGRRAHQYVNRNYSWSQTAQRFEELYERIANRPGGIDGDD